MQSTMKNHEHMSRNWGLKNDGKHDFRISLWSPFWSAALSSVGSLCNRLSTMAVVA